jgi:hypothetical protein
MMAMQFATTAFLQKWLFVMTVANTSGGAAQQSPQGKIPSNSWDMLSFPLLSVLNRD